MKSVETIEVDQLAFRAQVARSWSLMQEERVAEALAMLEDLVARYPDNPRAHFEYAGALDFLGREAEALAPYRRVQALGLSGDDLPGSMPNSAARYAMSARWRSC